MTETSHEAPRRTRDPQRSEKILAAAAQLMGSRGYRAVSMSEIGREAGITGSGIYRHFESKPAILVALQEGIIDNLLADQRRILQSQDSPEVMLRRLIDGQVSFVVDDEALARLYYAEQESFPAVDLSRIRRKQRLYLEEWVHLVLERDESQQLSDAEARTLVHATIGVIHSPLFHHVGLDKEVLRNHLVEAAKRVLCLDAE